MRREFKWTDLQLDKLNHVLEVLDALAEFKPLTLRQVYYQLVGKGHIENKKSEYGMLSNLLKWARIDGHVSWDDIEDRARFFHNAAGWTDKAEFIDGELRNMFTGYRRDLMQTQEKYLEVWIEKDALSSVFTKVVQPYCISTIVCRGFSSVSFLNDFKQRLTRHRDKMPVMLYFGDFDPSGMEMLEAMRTTLKSELKVVVEFKRIALMQVDVTKYDLPHNPGALKRSDTRAAKHLAAYGDLAVELDALPPAILQEKITDAINAQLDIDAFNAEISKQRNELDEIAGLRQKALTVLR